MGSFIADMIVYACPPAFIVTMLIITLGGLRRAFKMFREIEHRRILPVEVNSGELPVKLEKMIAQLRQRDFRYIGAYVEKYPTAKTQLRTPTLAFVHDQLNLVATCALVPWRLGKPKIGVLITRYPGNNIQTFYSLPLLTFIVPTNQSVTKTFRAGNLEKALARHSIEVSNYSQQFGKALVIQNIDDLMNELNKIDPDTARNNMRSALSKVFLVASVLLSLMAIGSIRYLIVYSIQLQHFDIVSKVLFSIALILALVFSVYHYLALRRSTL